jgi:hypothetical protein
MEGLINEEEDMIFETKLELISIGTIIFLEEAVSFLIVEVLECYKTKALRNLI